MLLVHKEKTAQDKKIIFADRNEYYDPQGPSTKAIKERVMYKQQEAILSKSNNSLFYEHPN